MAEFCDENQNRFFSTRHRQTVYVAVRKALDDRIDLPVINVTHDPKLRQSPNPRPVPSIEYQRKLDEIESSWLQGVASADDVRRKLNGVESEITKDWYATRGEVGDNQLSRFSGYLRMMCDIAVLAEFVRHDAEHNTVEPVDRRNFLSHLRSQLLGQDRSPKR